MTNRRFLWSLLALLLAADAAAQGQDAPASVGEYWEALALAPTEAAAAQVRSPHATSQSEQRMVEGLLRLRRYELTLDRSQVTTAISLLRRAAEQRPMDPWAHYALGLALARGSDMRQRPFVQQSAYRPGIYSNAASQAPKALRRALELDSTFDAAALELAEVALDIGDTGLLREATDVLQQNNRLNRADATYLSARIENRLNDPLTAIQLLRRAERLGFDASVAAHERVLALMSLAGYEEQAVKAYYEGIDVLTAAGAERYFAGVVQVASRQEVEQWRTADLAGRSAWLRRFWQKRAAVDGVSEARLITTLYRKLARASRVRGMSVTGGQPPAPRRTSLLGTIFPRVQVGDIPPQSRVYAGDELMSRSTLTFDTLTAFVTRIAMAWQALQFRVAPDGGSQVVGSVTVPAQSVSRLLSRGNSLDATLSIAIADTVAGVILRESAAQQYDVGTLDPNSSILLGLSIKAPPLVNALLRITLENSAGTAGAIARTTITVDRFHPDSLTMSDIVVSPPDARASFERGSVKVALAPGRIYRSDEAPAIYYEVYGLAADEKYTTDIALTRVRDGVVGQLRGALGRDSRSVSVRYEDVAQPDATYGQQDILSLALTGLEAGVYQMRVTITDAKGRRATRDRLIEIGGQ